MEQWRRLAGRESNRAKIRRLIYDDSETAAKKRWRRYGDTETAAQKQRHRNDGTETTIRDYFCVYSSPADCFEDYAELIVSNENYADAVGAKSPAVAARALQEGGYATDPYYASKVISVNNEYNLTRFDPMETPGSQKSDAASSETTSEEGEGK